MDRRLVGDRKRSRTAQIYYHRASRNDLLYSSKSKVVRIRLSFLGLVDLIVEGPHHSRHRTGLSRHAGPHHHLGSLRVALPRTENHAAHRQMGQRYRFHAARTGVAGGLGPLTVVKVPNPLAKIPAVVTTPAGATPTVSPIDLTAPVEPQATVQKRRSRQLAHRLARDNRAVA